MFHPVDAGDPSEEPPAKRAMMPQPFNWRRVKTSFQAKEKLLWFELETKKAQREIDAAVIGANLFACIPLSMFFLHACMHHMTAPKFDPNRWPPLQGERRTGHPRLNKLSKRKSVWSKMLIELEKKEAAQGYAEDDP